MLSLFRCPLFRSLTVLFQEILRNQTWPHDPINETYFQSQCPASKECEFTHLSCRYSLKLLNIFQGKRGTLGWNWNIPDIRKRTKMTAILFFMEYCFSNVWTIARVENNHSKCSNSECIQNLNVDICINVTSPSSIPYCSNSDYWTQKHTQIESIHSIILDVHVLKGNSPILPIVEYDRAHQLRTQFNNTLQVTVLKHLFNFCWRCYLFCSLNSKSYLG